MRIACAFVLVVGACGSEVGGVDAAQEPARFAASFADKSHRYHRGEAFTGERETTWREQAWRGDRIYKQLVVWSDATVGGLTIRTGPLVSDRDELFAPVRVRGVRFAKGDPESRACGGYPTHPIAVELGDALSASYPSSVTAGEPVVVWLAVDVPASASPGRYTGSIVIGAEGSSSVELAIELDVIDRELPPVSDWSFHLDLWQYPDAIRTRHDRQHPEHPIAPFSDEHYALLEPAYRLLADAGQSAITAHIKDGALGERSMIRWIRAVNGTWSYDFTAFDRHVATLDAWGIRSQISAFSIVGWNADRIPYWDEATGAMASLDAPIGSAVFAARWDHFLTQFASHLRARGWFERTVLFMDEVEDAKMQQVVQVVRANDPSWRMGLAYFQPIQPATKGAMYDLSGGIEIATSWDNPVSTFYTACGPAAPNDFLTANGSPAEMTWMAWHAAREGLGGYLRWAYDLWLADDPLDIREERNTAGDFSLIYHDETEVLSSIRLELLRDGIQDFEKMRILRTAPLSPTARAQLDAAVATFSTVTSGDDAAVAVRSAQHVLAEVARP